MGSHKNRPKAKKYKIIQARLKKHRVGRKFRIFSPDLHYLSSRFASRLKRKFHDDLLERKKLRFLFNFRNASSLKKSMQIEFNKNLDSPFVSEELEFCSLLERRLDFVFHRLGFVSTFFEAKQLISYKNVYVNGCFNTGFSYLLKKGDVISFNPLTKEKIKKSLRNKIRKVPFYLSKFSNIEVNFQMLKIIVLTEKFNASAQMLYYLFSLNWRSVKNT